MEPNRTAIENARHVLYEEGTRLRAQVFGTAHIEQSRSLPEFQQPIESMAVAAGWSLCWSRPGLERKTRSLLCLVMLSVLGRNHELAVHVRGAVENGCTEEEIREALFQVRIWVYKATIETSHREGLISCIMSQVSVYAGVPCALNATRIAWQALENMKSDKPDMNGVVDNIKAPQNGQRADAQ